MGAWKQDVKFGCIGIAIGAGLGGIISLRRLESRVELLEAGRSMDATTISLGLGRSIHTLGKSLETGSTAFGNSLDAAVKGSALVAKSLEAVEAPGNPVVAGGAELGESLAKGGAAMRPLEQACVELGRSFEDAATTNASLLGTKIGNSLLGASTIFGSCMVAAAWILKKS
ncbi:hypothetical protein SELMODRAFT_430871 [Selaginella moellendorffii]|uniref:Uncharacterized protein n=1 Tax=Selaginella moellendorffii TaxID=88036 RepID=D8TAS7_SELML|nr:hypothetical protein SELMODRAFT_430871 [Selaginella moellendorffii]